MWQIYSLAALIFDAAETTTDKVIMVADRKLDTIVTSFYRNFMYFGFSLVLGVTGIVGALNFHLDWVLLIIAVLEVLASIIYTILLKDVEMSSVSVFGYVAPFIFLLTDLFIFEVSLSGSQIAGVGLLILGAFVFVIDPLTKRLKKQYNPFILAILFLDIIILGVQYYVFKYHAVVQGINEISYMVSVWVWVAAGLLVVVLVYNKFGLLLKMFAHKSYLKGVAISKGFDVGSSVFWFHALGLAAVSQVNAFNAFYPFILLAMLFIVQQIFKFKTNEEFSVNSLSQKILAMTMLVAGALLAS